MAHCHKDPPCDFVYSVVAECFDRSQLRSLGAFTSDSLVADART